MSTKNLLVITKLRAIVLNATIALLLFSTMFLSFQTFVEAEIISKWYAFIGCSLLCCLLFLWGSKNPFINFDNITILTIIFIGYLLLREVLNPLKTNNTFIISLISFCLLCLSLKQFSTNCLKNIDLIILSVCTAQACYGLMQYLEIFHTYKVFKIIGSFDNPAGIAACLSAGFPFCLSVINKGGWKRYVGIISIILILVSILLSGSRAGILAITVVIVVYLGDRFYFYIKRYRRYAFLVLTILLIGICGLFFLKKDSAVGRILIWKNTCDMITDKPILGHGAGSFTSNYMQYQADYFKENPDSLYSMLADNVTHPFNEYLLLITEYGILSLLLLLSILFIVIKSSKQITILHLCLLSVGIFACFSYPLRYPFISILIAYSLANIKSKGLFNIPMNIGGKVVGIVLIGIICLYWIKDIQFEKHWGKIALTVNEKNNEKLLFNYEKLHSIWNGDPLFLYNYGAVLNRCSDYPKSNAVLIECAKYFNDYDVQMIIAENYFKLKQWEESKTHYEKASDMIPNRFMPLYKLMTLYDTMGNEALSRKIANIIINKETKVSSGTVSQIKSEAQKMINCSTSSLSDKAIN